MENSVVSAPLPRAISPAFGANLRIPVPEPEIAAFYGAFARPKLARFLKAMDLDKVYHRAFKNRLHYFQGEREEEVIDFLGGFGCLIVGHNNPLLVRRYKELLDDMVPFAAQMSARRGASLLCRRLGKMFYARFEREYMTTLVNTGTEAVEAAIKHAELEHISRRERRLESIDKKIMQIQMDIRVSGDVRVLDGHLAGGPREQTLDAGGFEVFARKLDRLNMKRLFAKSVFVAMRKSFHGKTSAALSLTHNGVSRQKFKSLGVSAKFVRAGNAEALLKTLEGTDVEYLDLSIEGRDVRLVPKRHCSVAAIFAEPIQGEGGIFPMTREFLAAARKMSDDRDIPLVFDEIQCGMGRTGTFLYSEQLGTEADYYLLSKGLGGGLVKVAALVVRKTRYQDDFGFLHTSTFGEDDISAGVAMATLDLVDTPESYQSAAEKGEYILSRLRSLQQRFPEVIKEVRGVGLMIGFEFAAQLGRGSLIISNLEEQGMLPGLASGYLLNNFGIRVAPTLSNSNTLRIEPSLTIRKSECDDLIQALDSLCLAVQRQNAYILTRFLIGHRGVEASEIRDFRNRTHEPKTLPGLPRAGFIGHCILPQHLYEFDPSLTGFSAPEMEQLMEKVLPVVGPFRYAPKKVVSDDGRAIAFQFYGFFASSRLISEYMRSGPKRALLLDKMLEFTEMAEEDGMDALGFGGFTSIIANNCKKIATHKLAVTSGNAFTVAIGLEAIRQACKEKGTDLASARVAIVGSLGNISSVYAEALSLEAGSILLVGRAQRKDQLANQAVSLLARLMSLLVATEGQKKLSPRMIQGLMASSALRERIELGLPSGTAELEALASAVMAELGDECPLTVSTDLMALRRTDVIIAASNSPEPIILPEMIGDTLTVICDIAVPSDVDPRVLKVRPGIAYIMGGVTAVPNNPDWKVNGVPLSPGYAYACMCETMTLAFAGIKGGFSHGPISHSQVEEIMAIASKIGFRLGKYKLDTSY